MNPTFKIAEPSDAAELAALHTAASEDLTRRFGHGFWSSKATERGVLAGSGHFHVVVARVDGRIAGSMRLQTKKPWAIDVSYFTPVKKAIYLTGMAVHPTLQRRGIGRGMLEEAARRARNWTLGPGGAGHAIRLDAFDAEAGAGAFYARCGFSERAHVTYKTNPLIYFEMLL